MESLFYRSYYKYFLWNKGLVEYYLSDKKSPEKIKLYVDTDILAGIGREMNVGDYYADEDFVEDFMESVECFCNYYNKYDNTSKCPLPLEVPLKQKDSIDVTKLVSCSNAEKLKKCTCQKKDCIPMQCFEREVKDCNGCEKTVLDFARPDFLAVAKHIACKTCKKCKNADGSDEDKCREEGFSYYNKHCSPSGNIEIKKNSEGKAEKFDLPFFAIVIYIILRFDEQETLKWDNLTNREFEKYVDEEHKKKCTSYLKIAPSSREYIKDLWKKIHNYNKRFDKDASIFNRDEKQRNDYVGKIRYHIPLSSPMRRRIYDAIYMSGIWNSYDTMPFNEQLSRIGEQIPESQKDELSRIFTECLRKEEYKDIYKNRIKDLLDNFDIDIYRQGRDRKRRQEQITEKGQFILAIYLPSGESEEQAEVRLYTTIPEEMKIENGTDNYEISEQKFSFRGYNGIPVKLNGRTSVEIKDHTVKRRGSAKVNSVYKNYDVVFFYTRDSEDENQLYIQTEDLVPAKEYIVAVKDEEKIKAKFESWCQENQNHPILEDKDCTIPLFGKNWVIYSKKGNWNGQYYQDNTDHNVKPDSEQVECRGNAKRLMNRNGCYFINRLPYFEIPEIYDLDKVEFCILLDNYKKSWLAEDHEYEILTRGRNLIINFKDTASLGMEFKCSIALEYNKEKIFPLYDPNYEIKICKQKVSYQQENLYKFNKYGVRSINNDSVIEGNVFAKNSSIPIKGASPLTLEKLANIPANAYFTNLLSAICYDKEKSEIRKGDFETCVSYANMWLGKEDNIDFKSIERALITAGIFNIDYTQPPKKYQIVPPAFFKVPFCEKSHLREAKQLHLLTGAYTKKFLEDLLTYCNKNEIDIYYKENEEQASNNGTLTKFFPPIILLAHNFNVNDFLKTSPHKCDAFNLTDNSNQDLAQSLLCNVASAKNIVDYFESNFTQNDNLYFLYHLETPKSEKLPRIRSDKNVNNKNFYIEKKENFFCRLDKSLLEWGYLYCYLKANKVMLVKTGQEIYLPHCLNLPWMVRRALYLMNMGFPSTVRAFVCSSNCELPYQKMDKYVLASSGRIESVAKSLSDSPEKIRDYVFMGKVLNATMWKMFFWKAKQKFDKDYLVLKIGEDITAIACKNRKDSLWRAYIKDSNNNYRLLGGKMNEVMSFLVQENWIFNPNEHTLHTSVGCRNNYVYTPQYKILNEDAKLPDERNFDIKPIKII